MDRLGLVIRNDRLRREARQYAGPLALLAAATLAVVVVRATTGPAARPSNTSAVVHVEPRHVGAVRAARVALVVVETGDTLGSIAARQRTSVARLLALNPGIEPTALHVGQRVRVR